MRKSINPKLTPFSFADRDKSSIWQIKALIGREFMTTPLMPKATAVWLIDNTVLTFEQIGDFCGLHALEIQGIADGEVAVGIVGLDPAGNGQLTTEELKRCETDGNARLHLSKSAVPIVRRPTKGARYTPVSKRQDRPDAIAWLLRNHSELTDSQVQKLLGTTKDTISKIRDRAHWNIQNIKPRDPVSLGICSQAELTNAVEIADAREQKRLEREARNNKQEAVAEEPSAETAAIPEEPIDAVPAAEAPAEVSDAEPAAETVFANFGEKQSDTPAT